MLKFIIVVPVARRLKPRLVKPEAYDSRSALRSIEPSCKRKEKRVIAGRAVGRGPRAKESIVAKIPPRLG